nr:hypothetical protein CFP56_07536 [Quercus suber]
MSSIQSTDLQCRSCESTNEMDADVPAIAQHQQGWHIPTPQRGTRQSRTFCRMSEASTCHTCWLRLQSRYNRGWPVFEQVLHIKHSPQRRRSETMELDSPWKRQHHTDTANGLQSPPEQLPNEFSRDNLFRSLKPALMGQCT